MKKLLSTIMALVMLLSLVPMAVATEGVELTEANSEAQINGLYYKTLDDAVSKVANGDTIKLVKDVTLTQTIVINDKEAKTIVLDLAGKTLKGNIDFYAGDLTIQNGTIDGRVYANATNADMEYGHLTIAKDAVIKGGFDENGNSNAVLLWQAEVSANNYGATVDIYGTLEKNLWVIGNIKTDLTTAENPCVVNIHDGAVIKGEDGTGVAVQGAAKVTVGKAAITGSTGIEVRAGELTVDGATVVGTAKSTTITPNGNGTTTDGAGIAVAQHTTKLPIKVTINSGDISGYSALYQRNPQKNDAEFVEKVSVAVNGGTFKAINGGTCGVYSENNCVTISGGAFTDLANAVKYAADGAIITLAGDTTGQVVIPAGKTITLDLGGKTLTNTKTAILNYGTLTVDNGTIVSTSNVGIGVGDNSKTTIQPGVTIEAQEGAVITSRATGATITINGGNFLAKDNAVIAGNGTKRDGEANTITINGGTFTGNIKTSGYIACGIYAPWKDIITVNDGTFIVNGGTGVVGRAGQVYIKGGTFTCTGTGSGWVGDNKNQVSAGQICYFDSAANYPGYDKDADGIAISAGAFNVAPDAKYLAEGMIVVPGVKDAPYSVQPAKRTNEEENTETEVKVDGDNVTVTVTDKATGTTTETVTDTKTGAKTETKTENKVEGNVTTKTETVTEKNAADETTKATETVTTEKTENGGKTTVVTKKDTLNKTETTEVTGVTAPTTAADVTLDVKNTTNVAVNKDSMTALKSDTVKGVIIETDQATLKLDKTAVKTMESNVPTNGKMTLNVTVTEEKNATATEIEKVKVEVTAKNEAGQNVFPENTANTNGLINITIPYTGNAKYLDLWYIAANASATYMGRFPVVNGFVSFDVKHFSQYNLIPVASSGSSVIKTGAGSSAASTTQTVTTDLTPGSITKVTVDGKVVDAKYYTVSGSNVTFTAEFLKTLKNGSHTVTVENATKIAKGVFTVNNPTTAQSPTTADAGIALYAGMAIASVMGTGVVFTSRKRKNH